MAKHTNFDKRDYKALRNSGVPAFVMASKGTRFDSEEAASVFFARELDYVKERSYDVQYPELTAVKLFPVSSEVDEGAETVTYYTYNKTGIGKVISNYSNDLPRADVDSKVSHALIKSIGASYGYSAQEMRASRLAGKSLDARKAEAARFAVDSRINQIAWAGDDESGLVGVLTKTNDIPVYAAPVGATSGKTKWTEKTADEILDDVNGLAKGVAKLTKNIERPDTLCVPAEVYMDIATRRLPLINATVLDYLLDHSPYIKDIISTAELDADCAETNPYAEGAPTVLPGDGVGVAFLFTNKINKLSLENPMPYMQYPAQIRNLETLIPCEARTAGVIVYYPYSAAIMTGVC